MENNNFTSRVRQNWTTYDNGLIQGKTIFKKASQKLCYMYLVSYSNCNKIFPSMPQIADAICSSKRSAELIIQELEEMGLIEVKRTPGKSNQYILNDYWDVAENFTTSEKISPAKKLHHTSEKTSPLPAKKLRPKTNIKKTIKTNISSSRESIDQELISLYPSVPFGEIKQDLLNDPTATIKTDKQYRKLLEYRLKNYQPTRQARKTTRKPIRQEIVPEWIKNTQGGLKPHTGQSEQNVVPTREEMELLLADFKK